jgi:UDP-glucose 4-epimerase
MPSLRGKRILVTGGAGFIGSHLVDRLVAEEPAVVVVVDDLSLGNERNLEQARARLGSRLVTYFESAANLPRMREIVTEQHIQVAYDLACIPLPHSLLQPVENVEVNVALALTLAELAREKRIETLVHFSSSEAYGTALRDVMNEDHPLEPMTPYAAAKLAGDVVVLSYIRTFGIDATILRPFNNYGPRQNSGAHAGIIPLVSRLVAEHKPIEIHGDGEQTRDLIFVRDTADAAVKMYETESTRGRVVNVASGIETSMNTLVRSMLQELGAPAHAVVHTEPRMGDVRRHLGGVALAEQLFGFRPHTALGEGLRATLDWYRNADAGYPEAGYPEAAYPGAGIRPAAAS